MKVREGRESGNTEVRIESAIAVRSSSLNLEVVVNVKMMNVVRVGWCFLRTWECCKENEYGENSDGEKEEEVDGFGCLVHVFGENRKTGE